MTRFIALVLVLLWPALAAANRIETFLGWSSDGTAYGYVDYNDGDGNEDVLLCRTDPAVPSASWPVGIKQGKNCTGLSCNDGTISYRDPDQKNAKDKLLRWNAARHEFLP